LQRNSNCHHNYKQENKNKNNKQTINLRYCAINEVKIQQTRRTTTTSTTKNINNFNNTKSNANNINFTYPNKKIKTAIMVTINQFEAEM
jgi:hypothetical protein